MTGFLPADILTSLDGESARFLYGLSQLLRELVGAFIGRQVNPVEAATRGRHIDNSHFAAESALYGAAAQTILFHRRFLRTRKYWVHEGK